MERLWLRARAPFAAFRALQAGVYRPTAPTLPPSAALGLVLNCAGIEMRAAEPTPITLIRADLPRMRIAIGDIEPAEVSTLYQQLHSYPVGSSGQENKERTFGAKYWIAPVKREVLVGLDVMIGVDADEEIAARVRRGLRGELPESRYGLPFAGDNNFLFDQIDILEAPLPARWYTEVDLQGPPRRGVYTFTVGIDRDDSSKTSRRRLAPIEKRAPEPPENAWTWVPQAPA
jgi:CRISPR-associated protein Cas5t